MSRPRLRLLARLLTLAATLPAVASVQAMVVVPADGLQEVRASLTHSISGVLTPPVTPTFPIQRSHWFTPGSMPAPSDNWPQGHLGGSGVATAAFVDGPAIFAPDLVRPFVGDAWAAASARTGQIRAQAHGIWFEQTRSLPRPSGIDFQFDSVYADGGAVGRIGNSWTVDLKREALLSQRADGAQVFHPLQFGITLEVDTRIALNTANVSVNEPPPMDQSRSYLGFSISFERLVMLDGSPRPDTLPDGSPSVITHTEVFAFDLTQQGRRTLRFDYELSPVLRWPAPPRTIWVPGTGAVLDYQDGLPHTCLDGYQPGTAWGEDCPVKISTEIFLTAGSAYNLAESSVSASWDARVAGGTEGIHRVVTDADQWGQPLDPALVLRPSLLAPVPEPGTWAMLLAGLGGLGWRLRQATGGRHRATPGRDTRLH